MLFLAPKALHFILELAKNKFYLYLGMGVFLNLASNLVVHAESDEKKPGYIYIKNELHDLHGHPGIFTNSINVEIDRMAFQNSDCYSIHLRYVKEAPRPASGKQVVKGLDGGSTLHQIKLEGNSHDHLGNACRFNVYITANDTTSFSIDGEDISQDNTTISCGSNFQPGDRFRVYSHADLSDDKTYTRDIFCEKVND